MLPPPPALDRLDGALGLMVDYRGDGDPPAAVARRRRRNRRARHPHGPKGVYREQPAHEPLRAGHGRERRRQGPRPQGDQGSAVPGRTRRPSRRRADRLGSRADHRAHPPAGSLFQIDEFGKFVANVADKRRAPKHLSEIWDLFTELATSAGTTFFGAEYADQRERPRQDIIEPCASIHGVSAPGPFWEALRSGSLQDGSLARFLVFRSDDDIPDRNRRPTPLSDLPAELLAAVQAVAAVGADQPRGNLAASARRASSPRR